MNGHIPYLHRSAGEVRQSVGCKSSVKHRGTAFAKGTKILKTGDWGRRTYKEDTFILSV